MFKNKSLLIASVTLTVLCLSMIAIGIYFSSQFNDSRIFWGFIFLDLMIILNTHFFHKQGVIDGKLISKTGN